ncbi:hypothetical protein E5351_00185 [Lactobacillus intestinalis]|uniref:Uncharacterized protein n=1 Tax=Lactobacillus intestinalis TaxID=151781 RepID=A0A4S2BSM5_9LACO|nr:hypothetical protein [Lactobacillus intestinalis]TGY17563.1 hypothetical protein E5351_00185 [Lactobacillus intestinalis]
MYIAEQMKNFSYFAEKDDMTHASDAIILICQETLMKPSEVLLEIKEASYRKKPADYRMAEKILRAMEESKPINYSHIRDYFKDAKHGIEEAMKSGNPTLIRDYVMAIKLDMDQVLKELSL